MAAHESSVPLPRVFVFGCALTCGVLSALAVSIFLRGAGLDLASAWHDLFPSSGDRLASALAWWLIGASGFAAGFIAVSLVRASAGGSAGGRLLQWGAAIAFVCALTAVGHAGAASPVVAPGARALASLAALLVGAFGSICGVRLALQTVDAPACSKELTRSERRRLHPTKTPVSLVLPAPRARARGAAHSRAP